MMMRKSLFCLGILAAMVLQSIMILTPASAYTDISSDVMLATDHWTMAGSPYYIKKNITVPFGVVLMIDAGVSVRFDTNAHLTIKGNITSSGTPQSPVTFTSNVSQYDSWGGIVFLNSGGSFANTIIEYATSAADLNVSWARFDNLTFRKNTHDIVLGNNSRCFVYNGPVNASKLIFKDDMSRCDRLASLTIRTLNPAKNVYCDLSMHSFNNIFFNFTPNTNYWKKDVPTGYYNRTLTVTDYSPYNVSIYSPITPEYFYHDLNLSMTGDYVLNQTVLIEPYFLGFPRYMNVLEDQRYDIYIQAGDPDNLTSELKVSSDKPYISILGQVAGLFHITLFISNPATSKEYPNVYITDGVSVTIYSMQLNITLVNDPPVIQLVNFVDVTEDVPMALNISVTDEDDPPLSITVTTDNPYATYNGAMGKLELLFPDDIYGTIVNVNASDGKTWTIKTLFINLTLTPDTPEMNQTLSLLLTPEDTVLSINLSDHFKDADYEPLAYDIDQPEDAPFISYLQGTMLFIEPIKDMWGVSWLKIRATDPTSRSVLVNVSVVVTPVPDPIKILNPRVTPTTGDTETPFWFLLRVQDPDGQAPEYVHLVLDGSRINITHFNKSSDYMGGVEYQYITKLGTGDHAFRFEASDGIFLNVTANRTIKAVTVAVLKKTMTQGQTQVDVYYTGHGTEISWTNVTAPPLSLPETTLDLGVYFGFDCTPASSLEYAIIYVDYKALDISYVYEDTLRLVRVTGADYSEINGSGPNKVMQLLMSNVSAPGIFSVIADVDPNSDPDKDGHTYENDAFPFDPSEWEDTDKDGIGDNTDTDDDNDGYSDSEELAAGSDPKNPDSVPSDHDTDGIMEVNDTDDDNDGIPDDWEIANGLDPKNASDAQDDPDGDGYTNYEEYQRGTDPRRSDNKDEGFKPSSLQIWIIVISVVALGLIVVFYILVRREAKRSKEQAAPKIKDGKLRKKRVSKRHFVDWDDSDEMDLEDHADDASLEQEEITSEVAEWDEEEEGEDTTGMDENLVDDADMDADENDLETFTCEKCGSVLPKDAKKCPKCKTEFNDDEE